MAQEYLFKFRAATLVAAIGVVGMLSNPPRLAAQDDEARIEQGLAIAPVNLTYSHKDRKLVGLGSYIVNASGDCNGCHSSGTPASLGIYPYPPRRKPVFRPAAKAGSFGLSERGREFRRSGDSYRTFRLRWSGHHLPKSDAEFRWDGRGR